ncbi:MULTISPECIES: hypothetical protein [Acinetobacter]|nr:MULTISPECIES: hypothetical protein [Acinetobacter]QEK37487.1 hypothetical protein FYN22_16850 [Acinetobacter johnsonii]QEK37766.1 hypothetical protein FYN22_18375 [Acinetobacter johnsonii]QEK37775.1 hypothetical protein FYN22_18420 [Acinetobacter johnsonii]QEK37781.1 hypothetical protein FYN22_18470 [Acinetobacter johnsonii]
MSPGIFFEDFEKTENSDYLHGVFGRCLVIATRFDSMCVRMSKAIKIKEEVILRIIEKQFNELDTENEIKKLRNEAEFNQLVEKTLSKYLTLDKSIRTLGLPEQLSAILHEARKSRNEIAHSLTRDLEGCIDTKIDNTILIKKIEKLIENIVEGDIIISILISIFNEDPILNSQNLSQYKDKIIDWVISP